MRTKSRNFHQARWDESLIFDMSAPGTRGVIISEVEEGVKTDVSSLIPRGFSRKAPPALPELGQMQVLRHYLRLSQEIMATDVDINIGPGTATMKYSPKINEQFVRSTKVSDLHPYQPESTVQGMLEIIYNTSEFLKEISGLDAFALQATSGSQAIYTNVSVIRAYHASRGEGEKRNEIITTMLSHPGNPGTSATLGYKVITLMPGKNGYPDLDALKAAISERTAALLITNPEDTGIFNPQIKEFTDAVHAVGGLCCYDQANVNGVFCLTRAKEAGFDMCHYNLHKAFSSPHGCQGPGAGASGVTAKLAKFLPAPIVRYDGSRYYLDYNMPDSVGKVRKFHGVPGVIVRAYAYIRSLGQEGLKQVAELAILNNNYMLKGLLKIDGLDMPFAEGVRRLEQARLSWKKMADETGIGTDDICRRIVDYGFQNYFTSHHPYIVPEPFTPEPTETYSKDDIDEFVSAFVSIAKECRENPEIVKTAPHNAALASRIDESAINDIKRFATTLRAYRKYVEKQ